MPDVNDTIKKEQQTLINRKYTQRVMQELYTEFFTNGISKLMPNTAPFVFRKTHGN